MNCVSPVRGDGPFFLKMKAFLFRYFPRPRGWTVLNENGGRGIIVFPPSKGVDRRLTQTWLLKRSISPVQGGEPQRLHRIGNLHLYLPRPRGWTAAFTVRLKSLISPVRGGGPLKKTRLPGNGKYFPPSKGVDRNFDK